MSGSVFDIGNPIVAASNQAALVEGKSRRIAHLRVEGHCLSVDVAIVAVHRRAAARVHLQVKWDSSYSGLVETLADGACELPARLTVTVLVVLLVAVTTRVAVFVTAAPLLVTVFVVLIVTIGVGTWRQLQMVETSLGARPLNAAGLAQLVARASMASLLAMVVVEELVFETDFEFALLAVSAATLSVTPVEALTVAVSPL